MFTFLLNLIAENQTVKLLAFKGQDVISEKEVCTEIKINVSSSQGSIWSIMVEVTLCSGGLSEHFGWFILRYLKFNHHPKYVAVRQQLAQLSLDADVNKSLLPVSCPNLRTASPNHSSLHLSWPLCSSPQRWSFPSSQNTLVLSSQLHTLAFPLFVSFSDSLTSFSSSTWPPGIGSCHLVLSACPSLLPWGIWCSFSCCFPPLCPGPTHSFQFWIN